MGRSAGSRATYASMDASATRVSGWSHRSETSEPFHEDRPLASTNPSAATTIATTIAPAAFRYLRPSRDTIQAPMPVSSISASVELRNR